MRMIEGLFDMLRLSDDAPDAGYGDLRGGAPVETPQERELSEGGHGVATGVARGWPGGGQGVATGQKKVATTEKGAARRLPWYSKGVPTSELSPLWWAKATRAVHWKWGRAVRQILWWILVAVTAMLAGATLFPEWAVFLVIDTIVFLLADPFGVLERRLAAPSRLLIATCGIAGYVAACVPHPATICILVVLVVLSAIMVAACNTEWVVTANYISSPTIHAAMANDPTSSAHRSWAGFGSKLVYTYSSEMGYPPTSNFIWGILRGTYVIGWTLGFRRVVTEDEAAEAEADEERASDLERQLREARGQVRELEFLLEEAGDSVTVIESLRERIRRLDKDRGESAAAIDYLRGEARRAREDADARAAAASREAEQERARHEAELDALRRENEAALATVRAECEEYVSESERALLGDSGGLREKLLLAEIRLARMQGVEPTQARLSEATGIPRTTVRRILEKLRADGGLDGGEDAA